MEVATISLRDRFDVSDASERVNVDVFLVRSRQRGSLGAQCMT